MWRVEIWKIAAMMFDSVAEGNEIFGLVSKLGEKTHVYLDFMGP